MRQYDRESAQGLLIKMVVASHTWERHNSANLIAERDLSIWTRNDGKSDGDRESVKQTTHCENMDRIY